MTCQELAARIERLQPQASPRDVARICLLLLNQAADDELNDPLSLCETWRQVSMRLQAAGDQHAAMTAELEELARRDLDEFRADQIWSLMRAVKVQNQVLQFYLGMNGASALGDRNAEAL